MLKDLNRINRQNFAISNDLLIIFRDVIKQNYHNLKYQNNNLFSKVS